MFALDLIGDLNSRGVEQRVAVIRRVPDGLDYGEGCVWLTGSPLRSVARLHSLVRRWRPDVVLAHGGESLKWLTPTLLRPASPPVVYRRIGMTPTWMAGPQRKRAHGFIIGRARVVVSVAEAAAQELTDSFGVERSSIELIGNAVDERRIHSSVDPLDLKSGLGLDDGARIVLFAGALTDEKDPLELIEVARRVCDEVPDVTFVVAGEGPLSDELTSAVAAAGLGDKVKLVGSRTDLPGLMVASEALVMTSRTEGIPGVAIEAGLSKLPVVAYGVGGVPEVVVDEDTGLLASHGDTRGLSDRLIRTLTERSLADELGANAKARCLELYAIEKSGALYLDLFSRIYKSGNDKRGTARSPLMDRSEDRTLTGEPR
jgi:L-malate glycosyltransferase